MIALTTAEVIELDRTTAPSSFNELVLRWRRFVESVPDYRYSIYDYDNDVDVRVQLDEALSDCSVELRLKALRLISADDELFFRETRKLRRSRYARGSWHENLPIDAKGQMREDIEAANL